MTERTEPRIPPPTSAPAWRDELRRAIRDPDLLIEALGLDEKLLPAARRAAELFPLVAPRPYLGRIRHGEPDDPLLRQILPLDAETGAAPAGFSPDPLGEAQATRAPGLLHKYRGRALLITTGVCAVACRYCFRRHFPYQEAPSGARDWEPALAAIRADDSLEEIILSGGDPLMQSDAWLGQLAEELEAIPHLRRLRVHSRLPIVIPGRVDDALLGWLSTSRLAPTLVVHANHPNEIDEPTGERLLRVVRAGVPVLNQSVLLRGVNDSAPALIELSKRLLDFRVLPYYLHQLDPVTGAAHFEVARSVGLELVEQMRQALPGLGVPRYVQEIAGVPHKLEVASPSNGRR